MNPLFFHTKQDTSSLAPVQLLIDHYIFIQKPYLSLGIRRRFAPRQTLRNTLSAISDAWQSRVLMAFF